MLCARAQMYIYTAFQSLNGKTMHPNGHVGQNFANCLMVEIYSKSLVKATG